MNDSPENALEEAGEWLRTAELALNDAKENCRIVNVACAEAIHAIIRANDALTLKFLKRKSLRHDDSPFLFMELIKLNKIEEVEKVFTNILIRAMRFKSAADYGTSTLTLKDAEFFVSEAGKFIEMAKKYILAK